MASRRRENRGFSNMAPHLADHVVDLGQFPDSKAFLETATLGKPDIETGAEMVLDQSLGIFQ